MILKIKLSSNCCISVWALKLSCHIFRNNNQQKCDRVTVFSINDTNAKVENVSVYISPNLEVKVIILSNKSLRILELYASIPRAKK